MKNHLGTFECKLCLTLHNNEGSYLAHTQGKKHQDNLYVPCPLSLPLVTFPSRRPVSLFLNLLFSSPRRRRAAREAEDAPQQPAPVRPPFLSLSPLVFLSPTVLH